MSIHSCTPCLTNILYWVFIATTYGEKYFKGAFRITTLTMINPLSASIALRNKSIDLHNKSIDWFLYEGNAGT